MDPRGAMPRAPVSDAAWPGWVFYKPAKLRKWAGQRDAEPAALVELLTARRVCARIVPGVCPGRIGIRAVWHLVRARLRERPSPQPAP